MNTNENLRKKRTPAFVWFVRVCLFGACFFFCKKLLASASAAPAGKVFFAGFLTACAVAFLASFVRSKKSLRLIVFLVVLIPLVLFLAVDIFVLHGSWLQLLIGIPMQIGIPLAFALYMWKAPSIQDYYSKK